MAKKPKKNKSPPKPVSKEDEEREEHLLGRDAFQEGLVFDARRADSEEHISGS